MKRSEALAAHFPSEQSKSKQSRSKQSRSKQSRSLAEQKQAEQKQAEQKSSRAEQAEQSKSREMAQSTQRLQIRVSISRTLRDTVLALQQRAVIASFAMSVMTLRTETTTVNTDGGHDGGI